MGADLILVAYRLPAGRKPDFARCRAAVLQWGPEKLEELAIALSFNTGFDYEADGVQGAAEAAINEVETAYLGHRYSRVLVFDEDVAGGQIEILVAGGMSWGDDPYEGFGNFIMFGELGLEQEW